MRKLYVLYGHSDCIITIHHLTHYIYTTSLRHMVSTTKTRLFKYIENFSTKKYKLSDEKNLEMFMILLKIIDCGYLLEPPRMDGSNEYPQSMFLSRNKGINVDPVNPSFT